MVQGTWLPCSMWDLPGPRVEPVSTSLAGGFLTTEPPGQSYVMLRRGLEEVELMIQPCISYKVMEN